MAITDELTYSSCTQCVANGFNVVIGIINRQTTTGAIQGFIPLAGVVGCSYASNDVAHSEESVDSNVLNNK